MEKKELIELLDEILKPQNSNHEFSWSDILLAINKFNKL